MTKFISYYARRNNLLAVFFLVFGTSIFFTPTAQAAYASTTIICADPAGQQRSFQVSWDNSNQFFADKGYIPRLYCEGGYAGSYRTYISDSLDNSSLGYFQGVVPVAEEPVVAPVDTSTATSETQTATADTSTATVDTQTSQSDTTTSSSDTTTATSPQETPTVTPQPTDSSTTPSDTPTVSPVDGSTATSVPEVPSVPVPPAPPVVEPEPVEEPAVVPEEPEPLPEPEVIEEVPQEEAPEPVIEPEVEPEEEVIPEPEPTPENQDSVTLDNGVVITEQQAVAIALLENPGELLKEIFSNPGAALAALNQVGADMSPEVRERSEEVVVAAVIVGNIASTAGAVAYRRKP